MNSNYIITSNGSFIREDELYHWGVKGMKWGVRRYQNPDGSLTEAGKKRYTNSDGTLNKKGEKYIAKETARLAAEKTRLKNLQKTDVQLAKLDEARKKNQDIKDQIDGKKTDESEASSSTDKSKAVQAEAYDMSSLTDKELNDIRNRLQSEDNLKDLLTKRGYNVSLDQKTEADRLIESLGKEKKLMELQKEVDKLSAGKTDVEKRIEILSQKRDVAKLEKEIRDYTPKKESKLSKFMNSQAGQKLVEQLVKSGENVVTAYIKSNTDNTSSNSNKGSDKNKTDGGSKGKEASKAAADVLAKTISKEVNSVVKSAEKSKARQAETESKQAAKDLNDLINKAAKSQTSSTYNSKEYEAKVDKLLSDMDSRAWEIYYEKYANK